MSDKWSMFGAGSWSILPGSRARSGAYGVGTPEKITYAAQWLACAPRPTLRRYPRGRLRTAWGRCGSLLLHRGGLSPPAPCRSPGAQVVDFSGGAARPKGYVLYRTKGEPLVELYFVR